MTNAIVGPTDDLAGYGSPSFSGSNNIVCNNAAGFPSAGIASISNPRLGALASNGGPTQTMLPAVGGPAMGAGTAIGTPSTDQRGAPRNGVVNIGAVQITNFSLAASLDQSRIMIGQTAALSGSITNVGGAGNDSINYTLGASITSGSGSLGTLSNSSGMALAVGLTSSPASTAIFTAGTATGPVTLSLSATATNTTLGGSASGTTPISVSLDVLAQRIVTASAIDLGVQHLGANLGASGTTTLVSPGPNNQFTSVTVGGTTFDGTTTSGTAAVSGTINALASSGTLTTLPVTTAENGGTGLPGEGSYANVVVPYTAQATSGNAVWTSTASGSWGTQASASWTDSGGTVHAAPGTFAGFTNTDVATFSGSGSVTAIDLTGVNPSLNALSFSNSSYTLTGGSLTLNGSTGTATVTASSGTQTINTPMTLASNANFAINGGALLLNSTIGGSGGFTKSGPGGLTLPGADTLSSTGPIAISQGTLAAPLGISHGGGGITVAGGATLQAAGQVNRAVTGPGTVTATGELFIGNVTQSGQFNQGGAPGVGGTLNVGSNAVILLSADTAILGSQTSLGASGSLTTLNGAQLGNATSLDNTKVLTATGNAAVNGNFVNNGVVNGPTGSGQELTFTQFVKGAGSTTGNIEYAGSYQVGNSPNVVSAQNVLFDTTSSLIMELAGTTPGSGYDQLDISGQATLNGALDVELLDGFMPSAGQSFDILSGPTTGVFSQISLPALNNGLHWNTSNLYASGTISVVPEPSTLALLGAGVLGLLGWAWRRAARGSNPTLR